MKSVGYILAGSKKVLVSFTLSLPVSCFVVFCFIEQEFRSGGDRRSLLIWSITTMSARHDTTGLFKTFRDPAGSVK